MPRSVKEWIGKTDDSVPPPRVRDRVFRLFQECCHVCTRAERLASGGDVTPVFDGARYDILFRMLEPHELAAAMGFTSEDQVYEFAGTKTEQIKQIGNAVSVAKMRACVSTIMADAAPKRKESATPLEERAAA